MSDWLSHRWQAAVNMNGVPIPGGGQRPQTPDARSHSAHLTHSKTEREHCFLFCAEHWVEVDLSRLCVFTRVLLDWETAYSQDYTISGCAQVISMCLYLTNACCLRTVVFVVVIFVAKPLTL
jgi:hypothetical protein